MPLPLDLDILAADVARLTTPEAVAAFLARLGYPTGKRKVVAPSGLGLGDTERQVTNLEVLSEDAEGFLRVVFARLKSTTAKARGDLVRAFGRDPVADHLLILTTDFDSIEFVLIDKERRDRKGATGDVVTTPKARVFVVPRRWPEQVLRILRRLTYTMDDGLRQFDKLRSVFDAAHFSGTYFQNRALFADHFLETRLRDDPAWKSDPGPAFQSVQRLVSVAHDRVGGKPIAVARQELLEPLWSMLGFSAKTQPRPAGELTADYLLADSSGTSRTVALVYPWGRWLDGPDPNDPDRPAENPGAAVVTLLERGDAEWAIVTNGKVWRLYSRAAHSRSTNFYEVDLQDTLVVSGQSDPNEAFRYWWLFFRLEAFLPATDTTAGEKPSCWLDTVAQGSRDYARKVEAELKRRVFYDVVPMLASGFIHDRRARLKKLTKPTDEELEEIRAGTLTLLYRLLFMLYAESRDLLPIREGPYYAISLKKLKEEVAATAGVSITEADDKLAALSKLHTNLYERLADPAPASAKGCGLFRAMASGHAPANVPRYNGGLFRLDPAEASDDREAAVCTFLNEHRVPDYFLASAIDRLSRVHDERKHSLEFVDYKSLGVRQLGSIYEGLLEFRLVLAEEDLAVKDGKALGEYIPLAKARGKASKKAVRQVHKGDPILQRDNAERKATGSYYTPDHIVQYIVENTVGPVLKRKLEALRPEFRKAEQTYLRHLGNAKGDARMMLGHAAAAALRARRVKNPAAKPEEADFRAFAQAQTHADHKDLVEKLFDMKVLDPAMGSGHFLVEAVDFITDELLNFLNAFPNNPVMAAIEQTRAAILDSLREQGIETDDYTRRQLTDIHLLKRHVLKRCIYGVDLNPLATELAKVSLWLDAFTLGAPLSFLDHHLRTGNSLIGSSLTELEATIHDQLFKIDESHLLRAVQNVLLVARLADATASEVAKSKAAFDTARQTLSGYGVLLDILVAQHLGHQKAREVLSEGHDLNLASHESFRASLNRQQRQVVDAVETLATSRRFFHWDLEFPEVFYSFVGLGEARVARRAPGDAGFDAIVGNPPYVRQETIKDDKAFLAAAYSPIFDAANDLFVYFMFREIELLRTGAEPGLMGMIVANKWLRAGYASRLRRYLLRTARSVRIIDFGHSPIFPDADTFPSVPIFARRSAALEGPSPNVDGEFLEACQFPREEYEPDRSIEPIVRRRSIRIPVALLRDEGWALDDPRVQSLVGKMRDAGQSLAKFAKAVPLRGVLTGLNEIFVIEKSRRDVLIAASRGTTPPLRPLLRGRDLARWRVCDPEVYLIAIWSSANTQWPWSGKPEAAAWRVFRNTLPAVADYLEEHEEALRKRQDQGHFWWELRSCDYIEAFGKPKIVWQEMAWFNRFSIDPNGCVILNTAYLLEATDPTIIATLNSRAAWWYMWRTAQRGKDDVLRLIRDYMNDFPIPRFDPQQRREVGQLAEVAGTLDRTSGNAGSRLSVIEHRLSEIVEEAYGLTPEERTLLCDTRPVRDPLDVLDALNAGQSIESPITIAGDAM